jgi:acetyl-CoA C-acetyltransferase
MGWNKVALVGVGMIPFGELFDKSWEVMIEEAYLNCIRGIDKGFNPKDIKAAWIGTARPQLHGQGAQGGVSLVGQLGLAGIPCTRVENGCPTGSDAIRNAAFGVASGVYDVVLAAGYEKMRDAPTSGMLGIGLQGHPLLTLGETAMTMFAPKATRYMHEYGLTKEQMALVAVKNRKNGVLDPYAQFRFEITVEDVLKSPVVCEPLNILDCCPQTDGAACAILCRADLAEKYTDKPIYIAGMGCGTDVYYMHEVTTFTSYPATVRSAQEAYKMAGIGPQDIDLAEIHDCFTITEIIDYEDLGFCERGKGKDLIEKGETERTGRIPCNPSGGLICKGHPLGATGIAQCAELYWHLREEVGERQVEIKKGYGLQHNVGGRSISNSVVIILSCNKP